MLNTPKLIHHSNHSLKNHCYWPLKKHYLIYIYTIQIVHWTLKKRPVNKKLELSVNIRKMLDLVLFLAVIPILSGCWLAAAAGAGAYGGYKMKEKGYTIQNPVTKEKKDQKKSE
jgi:hypothetical protein